MPRTPWQKTYAPRWEKIRAYIQAEMELPDNQDCDCGLTPVKPCEYCRAKVALRAAEGGQP